LATNVSNEGEILNSLGRTVEARQAFTRALAVEERSYGKDSTTLAYPLQGLGVGYLLEHEPVAALAPFERALRIREAHETDRALVAENSFALPRALRGAGRDRERARKLAETARAIYAEQPAHKTDLADVERWMAER